MDIQELLIRTHFAANAAQNAGFFSTAAAYEEIENYLFKVLKSFENEEVHEVTSHDVCNSKLPSA